MGQPLVTLQKYSGKPHRAKIGRWKWSAAGLRKSQPPLPFLSLFLPFFILPSQSCSRARQSFSNQVGPSGARPCLCHMAVCYTATEVVFQGREESVFAICLMCYGNVALTVYCKLQLALLLCYVVSQNMVFLSSTLPGRNTKR